MKIYILSGVSSLTIPASDIRLGHRIKGLGDSLLQRFYGPRLDTSEDVFHLAPQFFNWI